MFRKAWKENGIELKDELGPINMNFGMTPVRLNPDLKAGEVVWATRIDPVRAKLDSIPYKESGYKYGDIVLHDGAAEGYRKVGEIEYPVFNALELFESSKFKTSIVTVLISSENDLTELEKIFSKSEHNFEDWTTNVRTLCRQCSEGASHERHDKELTAEWSSERVLGVAVAESNSVLSLFEQWQKETGSTVLEFD